MNKNLDFKRVMEEIDLFEKKFKINSQDQSLLPYIQGMLSRMKEKDFNKNFDQKELKEIQSRLVAFSLMFSDKKQQLKEESSQLLRTETHLKSYITNSNIKNNK